MHPLQARQGNMPETRHLRCHQWHLQAARDGICMQLELLCCSVTEELPDETTAWQVTCPLHWPASLGTGTSNAAPAKQLRHGFTAMPAQYTPGRWGTEPVLTEARCLKAMWSSCGAINVTTGYAGRGSHTCETATITRAPLLD